MPGTLNVGKSAWFSAAQDKAVLRQFQFVAHCLQAAILRWGNNPTKIQILKKNISDNGLVQCSKFLSRGFFRPYWLQRIRCLTHSNEIDTVFCMGNLMHFKTDFYGVNEFFCIIPGNNSDIPRMQGKHRSAMCGTAKRIDHRERVDGTTLSRLHAKCAALTTKRPAR